MKGAILFRILSTINGKTKQKNPPSNLSDILTIASVSLARKFEYFSRADGTWSSQLNKKYKIIK